MSGRDQVAKKVSTVAPAFAGIVTFSPPSARRVNGGAALPSAGAAGDGGGALGSRRGAHAAIRSAAIVATLRSRDRRVRTDGRARSARPSRSDRRARRGKDGERGE